MENNSPPNPAPPQPQQSNIQRDLAQTLIPTKNKPALFSYYFGIFGLVPIVGWILGFPALILGIQGLNKYKQNPTPGAKGHAIFGIITGILEILLFVVVGGNLLLNSL